MRRILRESGFAIEEAGKILELGVAGGRLIRHLQNLTPKAEIWGVDFMGECYQMVSGTPVPAVLLCHNYGGASSALFRSDIRSYLRRLSFTHLDDLVEAWFLELQRILNPGGRLYFTINDRHAVSIFEGAGTPGKPSAVHRTLQGDQCWQHWINFLHSNQNTLNS